MDKDLAMATEAAIARSGDEFTSLSEAEAEVLRLMRSCSIYSTLQVEEDVQRGVGLNRNKIKENFQRSVRLVHPDKCFHCDAVESFRKLRTAYEQITSELDNPTQTPLEPFKPEVRSKRVITAKTSRLLKMSLKESERDELPIRSEDNPGVFSHVAPTIFGFHGKSKQFHSSCGTREVFRDEISPHSMLEGTGSDSLFRSSDESQSPILHTNTEKSPIV
jgi:hypothetical protein